MPILTRMDTLTCAVDPIKTQTLSSDGAYVIEEWRTPTGVLHRLDGPAVTVRTPAGTIRREMWWKNGQPHRLDGPARIVCHWDGSIAEQHWFAYGKRLTPQQQENLAQALNPATPLTRLRQLATPKNPAIRRTAILHPTYPQDLRFLAELEHPDWF